jgi:hypothetical protein
MRVVSRKEFLELLSQNFGEEGKLACEEYIPIEQAYAAARKMVSREDGTSIKNAPSIHFSSEASADKGALEMDRVKYK